MAEELLEQTFNVASPARLKLSNIRGSVTLVAGEANLLTVKAEKRPETGDAGRTKIQMSQDPDGKVVVETHHQDAWWAFFSFFKPCKVDYLVHIPPECELEISCVSSSITLGGMAGKFKLSTVSGEIAVENLSGEMKISSVSGEISGVRLAGALNLDTVSGEVRLMESMLPSAHMTTVSGELRVQTGLADGPYRFQSVSGNVWLSVPADTHCSLELQSVSGSVNANLPVTRQKRGGGHAAYEVQGGGVRVSANSVSGSLFIESDGSPVPGAAQRAPVSEEPAWVAEVPVPPVFPIPPAPPLSAVPEPPAPPPVPPEPPLDRATILDRIERGEMSVEEGLKALEKMS